MNTARELHFQVREISYRKQLNIETGQLHITQVRKGTLSPLCLRRKTGLSLELLDILRRGQGPLPDCAYIILKHYRITESFLKWTNTPQPDVPSWIFKICKL